MSDSKVISLRGGEIIPPGEPRPKIIELAEEILNRAKSGDLIGLSVVLFHADDGYSWRHEGNLTDGTVGCVERLKFWMLRDMEE